MYEEHYVDTPLGKLVTSINKDSEYPEIFIYLEREDNAQIDLVGVCINPENKIASAYLYEDTMTEGWTKKHTWSSKELNIEV